jgi:PIN domain nuclease of toxin-antitoxin system
LNILLDTHIFLWWACEPERISQSAYKLIQDRENRIFFSAASSWEVQIKAGIGKLVFSEDWEIIVNREIEKNDIRILPVTLEHTFSLKKLPPLHKDPFDRMLIAQALTEKLVIITNDRFISQYPGIVTKG